MLLNQFFGLPFSGDLDSDLNRFRVWMVNNYSVLMRQDCRFIDEAIIFIDDAQTSQEKAIRGTIESNGVGWSTPDARMGAYIASYARSGRKISGKYLTISYKFVSKYGRQLIREGYARQGLNNSMTKLLES
jgi:hypothetical protein